MRIGIVQKPHNGFTRLPLSLCGLVREKPEDEPLCACHNECLNLNLATVTHPPVKWSQNVFLASVLKVSESGGVLIAF